MGHTCEGGQFCWEDDVMVKVNSVWYPGVYEGYGYAMIHCPEGRQPFDQTAGEMVLLREFGLGTVSYTHLTLPTKA